MDFDAQRRAQRLDLNEIQAYLEGLSFTRIKLEQQWRHITGRVTKDGISQFFKLSSTPDIAQKTRNEYTWNQAMHKALIHTPISIPRNYESGAFGDLFWFTCEFIEGPPLVEQRESNRAEAILNYLDAISQTLTVIMNEQTGRQLPNDLAKPDTQKERIQLFLNKVNHWAENSDGDTDELYEFLTSHADELQTAPSHGDFSPWHLIKQTDGHLFLIDGEHGQITGVKFYDAAYFYHRIFTGLMRPDIADRFLQTFFKTYSADEDDLRCFRAILAQRVIGGYFDAKNDGQTDLKLHDELRNRIVSNSLLKS